MAISVQQLQQILPNAGRKAGVFVPGLNATMGKYSIITPRRMAAFLAQVGHESGQLLYVRELGNDAYLAKYDTGRLAERLGNTPQADGDGQRYRGRGLIQITGRDNYEACSEALFGDSRLLNTPDLLEQPVYASLSAGWYWQRAGLNTLADKVASADDSVFESITRRINGGLNGLKDRQALYKRALEVLQ
ncbi:glycoside hydrolase family 19 protein [Pseudomonas inefficax]|uniref:glycoside hydrolase family 19 protein n=1 Tax=Pseudomonas sp. SIMBA_068 TaxID=3085808 RepID=UPI002E7D5273|nr:glycoside hydrolase family 19 protein [Pseudomonas inefficax]MEE1907459.1 glycoside hydrolase family 19 protein [Pseudomonas inefficax]MEE1984923.1 glycoside hydrolase family 19 protein [Pseudomonas inefficax]